MLIDQSISTPQTEIVAEEGGAWIIEPGGGGEVIGLRPGDGIVATDSPYPMAAPAPRVAPTTPTTSTWLYTAAIALGLVVLLGGRSRR